MKTDISLEELADALTSMIGCYKKMGYILVYQCRYGPKLAEEDQDLVAECEKHCADATTLLAEFNSTRTDE